uniref:hypothetical protein n=1 Tax=Paraburkholderia flagellata TaxID=2883241 RepID=UPI001F3777B6|nr:hypothetical protein [Paraburkholderia flagellata]
MHDDIDAISMFSFMFSNLDITTATTAGCLGYLFARSPILREKSNASMSRRLSWKRKSQRTAHFVCYYRWQTRRSCHTNG